MGEVFGIWIWSSITSRHQTAAAGAGEVRKRPVQKAIPDEPQR